jgi:NTE family protein
MSGRRSLDLALQGGGAHGAFTWGVLERLLEEERIQIDALSGASAGAINAVVFAHGCLTGGRHGARQALWSFWKQVGRAARQAGWHANAFEYFIGPWVPPSRVHAFVDFWSRLVSPYQFNPLNLNPLADILRRHVDFDRLRRAEDLKIFVSATQVRTGRLRVFRNRDLSVDCVMASACLPLLFHAVSIEGEDYWDGGYVGNPALLPLIAEAPAHDLVLVQINPSARQGTPRSPQEIMNRLNEITFNNSLIQQMRAVAILKQALEAEGPRPGGPRRNPLFESVANLLVHRIEAEEPLGRLDDLSKLNPQWDALVRLHGLGRRAADAWLDRCFDALGARSTVDLAVDYL